MNYELGATVMEQLLYFIASPSPCCALHRSSLQ